MSAPAVSTLPPSANAIVCRKFGKISTSLGAALAGVAAAPGGLAAAGAAKTLRRVANLLGSWSNRAKTVITGTSFTSLPIDLLTESIQIHVVAADLQDRDPAASTNARDAIRGLARVSTDCA